MPEARDRDVKGRQPAKRLGSLGTVDVEHAADDPPVLAAGDGVAGEQHAVLWQVHRDAPRRVAGSGHRDRAVAKAEVVAVEMKRQAGINAVEQLTRYLELLNRDPLLSPVHGVLAAQTIKLQARTLAEDRGIRCVVLDYDAMRGIEREGTLF